MLTCFFTLFCCTPDDPAGSNFREATGQPR
jgi:hypothetical protein